MHFAASAAPVTQLKVMSFNIWINGGLSLNHCIEAIRTNNADIVGLQECSAATAQTIATQLGYFWAQDGTPGASAVVSRYPIVHKIGPTQNAYGGLGVVAELSPGQRVHFFSAHLNYTPYGPYWLKDGSNTTAIISMENAARMSGLNAVLNLASPYLALAEPVFVVGDFNAPSHLDYADLPWPTSIACVNAGLGDSYRELHPGNRTYPGAFAYDEPGVTWTPKTSQEPHGVFDRIDFVHYSLGDGVTPTAAVELDERNSVNPWPSDHRAVLTTFSLTPPMLGTNAVSPFPVNGATNALTATPLMWTPASNMISQTVHFGTNSPGLFQTNTTNSAFSPGALAPDMFYFWRIDTTTGSGVITGAVWSFKTAAVPVPPTHTYEWTFALGGLQPALGHGAFEFCDNATSNLTLFGTTDGAAVPHVGGEPSAYMRVPQMPAQQNGFLVTFTDSGPNGGGEFINQYTVVLDILIPSPLDWTALFNTDTSNNNDADFYVSPSGAIGSTPGYSGNGVVSANTWHRLAHVADLAAGTLIYYVNGAPVRQSTGQSLDGRWALYSANDPGADLLLFNEGDASGNYTHELLLSAWAFVDRALTEEEITALGGPEAGGIFGGAPLRVTASVEGTDFMLNWDGGKGPFLVERAGWLGGVEWEEAAPWDYGRSFAEPLGSGAKFYRVIGN